MKQLLLFIVVINLLTSCTLGKESSLTDAGLFTDGKKSVLFTIEQIYNITSKETGGGINSISGYTDIYLNAIDANSGGIIKRVKIGDFKKRIQYLGIAGGKVWFFSQDPDISLHVRDPVTLNITLSIKDIIAKNPMLSVGLVDQLYQNDLDSSGKYIYTTTKDGYNYLIDPVSLKAIKTNEKTRKHFYLSTGGFAHSYYVLINDSLKLTFLGNNRQMLQVEKLTFDKDRYDYYSKGGKNTLDKKLYYKTVSTNVKEDISFIDPNYILDITQPVGIDNRDPVLLAKVVDKEVINVVFVVSKTMLGDSFDWVITAIEVDYNEVKQLWQYVIDNTGKLSSNNKDFLAGFVSDHRNLIVVFENTMLALDKADGNLVWRKDIRTKND